MKCWFIAYLVGSTIAAITYIVTIDDLKKRCDQGITIELKGTQYVCAKPSYRTIGPGDVL